MLPVGPALSGPVSNQVRQQTASVCIASARPPRHGRWMHSACLGRIWTFMPCHLWQSGGEVAGIPVQENHSDCPKVAQHALVLGPSGHFKPNPIVPAQPVD